MENALVALGAIFALLMMILVTAEFPAVPEQPMQQVESH